MKIPDGTVHPRDVLHGVLANGGAERLLRGEVLTRSAAGNRWTKKRPRSRRDLYRARQERARNLRMREGMVNKITVLADPIHYSFRRAGLYAAARILGLRQPIEILVSTEQREHGAAESAAGHSFKDGRHVIRIDDRDDASARDLSDSLWHELIHAMQAEADPDFRNKYIAEQARVGYDENRFEVEANELRDELAPGLGLVR